MGELVERFLEEYAAARNKPAALAWTRTVVRRYIAPELGKLALAAVDWFLRARRRSGIARRKRLCHAPIGQRIIATSTKRRGAMAQ